MTITSIPTLSLNIIIMVILIVGLLLSSLAPIFATKEILKLKLLVGSRSQSFTVALISFDLPDMLLLMAFQTTPLEPLVKIVFKIMLRMVAPEVRITSGCISIKQATLIILTCGAASFISKIRKGGNIVALDCTQLC